MSVNESFTEKFRYDRNNNPVSQSLTCCNQNDDPNERKENQIDLIKFKISNSIKIEKT